MGRIHSKVYDAKPAAQLFGGQATEAYMALEPIAERSGTVAEAMDALSKVEGATKATLTKAEAILKGADGRKAERSARRIGL